VVAIDPVPSNCALIEVNLALNGLHAVIEQCAVSAVDGPVAFSSGSCGRILERRGTVRPARRLRDPQTLVQLFETRGFDLWWVDRSSADIARYTATTPWPG
jgi:hypothetical protein